MRKPSQMCSQVALIVACLLFLLTGNSALAKTVTIGGGKAGEALNYPKDAQKTLNLQPGDTLLIASGSYVGMAFGDLNGTAEQHITVQCAPGAVFTTAHWGSSLTNVSFVDFVGFRFDKFDGRVFITGACHDLLFKDFTCTNLGQDYFFFIYDKTKAFDGTKASTFYNFKWENFTVDNKIGGGVVVVGNYDPIGSLKSVALDFEFSHCRFANIGNGSVIGTQNCFNLKVHDCVFSDIGDPVKPANHGSTIGCSGGYATVYNNTFRRHWGDDVRMFPAKLNALGYNGPEAISRYYNNISYEKKKYPVYENNMVSDADLALSKGLLSRTTSEVCFNTLYRTRKLDYIGTLCDILGPGVVIRYNLIVEPECDAPFDPKRNYVYQITGSAGGVAEVTGNLVFPSLEKSGLSDAEKFSPSASSPAKDAAKGRVPYISTDHDGNPRYVGAEADVGAIEAQ